jgi:hypothetical protein
MSIISVKELNELPSKTLIYFTSEISLSSIIPQSHVYNMPSNLSRCIYELRKFYVSSFPIVCYDDEEMRLSSQAYWIFKALGYDALVLYGGIKACEEQQVALTPLHPESIPLHPDLHQIDKILLPMSGSGSIKVDDLPFLLYEVLGQEINKQKVHKLLDMHAISRDYENSVISGYSAPVFGVILIYLDINVRVYLGDWQEIDPIKTNEEHPETFHTVAESIYYDAIEADLGEYFKDSEVTKKVVVEHYEVPLINIQRNNSSYKKVPYSNTSCGNCKLL